MNIKKKELYCQKNKTKSRYNMQEELSISSCKVFHILEIKYWDGENRSDRNNLDIFPNKTWIKYLVFQMLYFLIKN